MESIYNEKKAELLGMTEDYLNNLLAIWRQCFGNDMCLDNMAKLLDHLESVYDDLIIQSEEKREYIKNEIDGLHKEAQNLKRLLNMDVQLPQPPDEQGVPLIYVQSQLDRSLEELREELRARRDKICELLLEQETLCEALGEPPRALLDDPLPTAEELEEFRDHLNSLEALRIERLQKLTIMRRDIKKYLQILELKVNTDTEERLLNERGIKLSKETFKGLQQMHDKYAAQMAEMDASIGDMRKKLQTLWERLNTSPRTRDKFQRYKDCDQTTYTVLLGELQRCETLKSQNLKTYVQQIRQEIISWWDKTLKSEEQRKRFSYMHTNGYTDDLLVLHEMELEELKEFYESNAEIFELLSMRKELWERMVALEAKASEPGRYNNRGGQLLKEEKERKTIALKLPKIEQQISDLVHAYEEREDAVFTVYGENILEFMSNEWERKRLEKEKLRSARKNVLHPTPAHTPTPHSHLTATIRTPMSLKNSSTTSNSMRKTPLTTNLSCKRYAYTTSAQKSNAYANSAQKRRLAPSEQENPIAKRSLLQALNSPTVFLRPPISAAAKRAGVAQFKSPLKRATRAVASAVARRRSGRISAGKTAKQRRSMSKKPIQIQEKLKSSAATDNDYKSFEKCIESNSRSSVLLSNTEDENAIMARLPNPRSPCKLNPQQRIPAIHVHSPTHFGSNRKLATKNLPLII